LLLNFYHMKVSFTEGDAYHQASMKRSGWLGRVRRAANRSPILLGACVIVVLLIYPGIWLCIYGESFFSLTRRLPAEVLVVEGWIGNDGLRNAAAEFERGAYQYIVTTGGQTWDRRSPSNYADLAGQELIRLGVPQDRIIIAPTGEIEHERTFNSAAAAWRALQFKGIHPQALNVFTLGVHARRSRFVYAKVYAPATQVGVIAWTPSDYEAAPWWRSSRRTKCLLKEIVKYPLEVLLNSGRTSNSPSAR
jgi:hypothetical protein